MSRIEIKNITKKFGDVTALNGVTLNLEGNHIYGLLGRNGAGKTTLLNLITGRMFPTEGEIQVDGEKVLENDRALSKMYCMSELNLYPERMKVRDAFRWSGEFFPDFDKEYAQELCEKFERRRGRSEYRLQRQRPGRGG
jgi:ABC-2 type transport system ATP-binding protein